MVRGKCSDQKAYILHTPSTLVHGLYMVCILHDARVNTNPLIHWVLVDDDDDGRKKLPLQLTNSKLILSQSVLVAES